MKNAKYIKQLDVEYMWIVTRGGGGVKKVEGGIVILARCKFHFIREHENMVQDPCNNISVFKQTLN